MLIIDDQNLDKRILRTRKALRQAFKTLMEQKPFEQITVLDIADEAMINRATFYAHFADKYDLLDYMLRYMFNEHLKSMMPSTDRLPHDNLRCLTLATLTFLQQFIVHCAPSDRNSTMPFEPNIQSYLFDVIVDWLEHHDPQLIPDHLSTDLIATSTSASILSASLYYARGNTSLEQDVYIDQLMDLLTNGVCTVLSD